MSTKLFFTLLTVFAIIVVVAVSIREVVASSNAAPEMDSATRSYIAWGEALKAANKEGLMVPVAGYGNTMDSATRSYIAWGNAIKAANSAPQPLIAWAKACGVDLSYTNNAKLDSATRSYISWANYVQCGNTRR